MTKILLAFLMLATMSGTASARSKRFYDASGKGIGTYSTDSQGTRTFYDSRGKVIGRESTSGNTTTVYVRRARHWQATVASPQKITFGEMREGGTREVLVYCRDHRCSHHVETNADGWPDDVRLSDIKPGFVCTRCGRRGAEVRRNFRTRAWATAENFCTSPVACAPAGLLRYPSS